MLPLQRTLVPEWQRKMGHHIQATWNVPSPQNYSSGVTPVQEVSRGGHKESLISYLPTCRCRKPPMCCPLLSEQSGPCKNARNTRRPEKLLLAPTSWCGGDFLGLTKHVLQWSPLSVCHSLLLRHL